MAEIAIHQKSYLSGRVAHFTESVIREMTRQAMHVRRGQSVAGFPDFPALPRKSSRGEEAIAADINQYAITWGAKISRSNCP